jgi:ribonucleoside-diphosphate reductase alpha chain
MANYNNFQSNNAKHSNSSSRTNIYEADFNPTVNAKGMAEVDNFTKNLDKYIDFVSWGRWNPDLFWDLITPETGGIRLDLDQRVFLRCLARFITNYGVFPRGYGKTLLEIMGMYHTAIFFPDIELTMTAQTRENAAKLVDEKHREILKFYPLMANEITKYSNTKDTVEVIFTSGARIDVMANAQSSKGARRKRLSVEEAAQINAALFEDVLEPIVNVPRRTIGKQALIDPHELNGQISFFTTSWFRGSDEFERNLHMIDNMADLKGNIVLGSDWQLACSYGRGETRSQLLDKKAKLSPTFFAMNYESRWTGATDGSLVSINKVMDLRTLTSVETKAAKNGEYVLSMDVARSEKDSNNQSSIAVLRIIRSKTNKIKQIKVVNLINLPNGLNFTGQTIELKRIAKIFNPKRIIIDGNGLGSAIVDECLKEQIDPLNGETLDCWDTMNNDKEPEIRGADKLVYDLHSQGINTDIIINFIDMIESQKLQLLQKNDNKDYDVNDADYIKSEVLPFIQTDLLLEEIANLKLKKLPSGKYSIEQVTKKINKDRYSAIAYGLWYIKEFEDKQVDNDFDMSAYMFHN